MINQQQWGYIINITRHTYIILGIFDGVYDRIYFTNLIPVVPHKAVAEVSKIGNL